MPTSVAAGAWQTASTARPRFLPVLLSVLLAISISPLAPVSQTRAATLPSGFAEQVAFNGLINPTVVRFAADGRIFVAEKRGVIQVFDSLSDPTPTQFADLRRNVYNFWDRGLLGMALAPNFPADPYVYVLYAYDAEIGDPAPKYGNPPPALPTDGDPCPTPPGPTSDGCVVSGRLSRLQAAGNVMTGPEQVLIEDWCQQYPSHSTGSVEFAADGSLYVSGGDGASFTFTDYGQDGNPVNPCGDPHGGASPTPPTAEGGALRSQDLRTSGDPVSLDGAILRVDPATGAGVAGNPLFASSDPNAQRIIAYGTRNPFRMIVRPGTNEAWIGDVGYTTHEEINRLANPAAPLENFGWPCYEGSSSGSTRQPAYDSANLNICENLYTPGDSNVIAPFYAYNHSEKVVSGEACPSGSSSVEAGAFYQGGDYPSSYADAFFFADYSRDCIWVMPVGVSGLPNPAARATFAAGAANPVDLEIGPGGDLFYVDFDGGTIRRITYTDPSGNQPPTAQIVASATSGSAPLTVSFSATSSTDPDPGTTLSYAWDLDNDGAFDDGSGSTANRTFNSAGVYTVRLKVDDGDGAFDIDTETILVDAHAPTAVIDTPTAGTTWQVGNVISFSGHASDAEQGTLPPSALDWSLVMHHCPSNCHNHVIQTFDNMASGSFTTPDHEYPSHMELKLTATDATGLTHTVSRILNPQTVNLTFTTNPSGLQVVVGPSSYTAPTTHTVIVGSTNSVTAPSPQTVGATTHSFISWSDGGAQSHNIVAPATATTYTATYTGGGPPTTILNPTDDARIAEQSPTSNKGSDPELRVRQQAGASHRSYLKFVVSGLSGAPASVKLRLFVTDNSSQGGTLHDVSDGWTEGSITWNNAPVIGGTPVGVLGSVATGTWAEVDLTSYVTGNGTYSIGIQSTSTNAAIYSSTEGANPPQLVISMTGTPGPVTPIDDARVVEASPTANNGSDVALRVRDQTGGDHRSYLKFVVSGLSGAPSQVKLRLWVTDASPNGGSAYDVSDAWNESTITWNNAPIIGGAVLASFGNVVAGTWAEIDLTSYVTGNGTYSIGIQSTNTNAAIYSSAEGTNPPQLVITP